MSNKPLFPTFARTSTTDSFLNFVVLSIMREYNWSRIAVISGDGEGTDRGSNVRNMLVQHLKKHHKIVSFDRNFDPFQQDDESFFSILKRTARGKEEPFHSSICHVLYHLHFTHYCFFVSVENLITFKIIYSISLFVYRRENIPSYQKSLKLH